MEGRTRKLGTGNLKTRQRNKTRVKFGRFSLRPRLSRQSYLITQTNNILFELYYTAGTLDARNDGDRRGRYGISAGALWERRDAYRDVETFMATIIDQNSARARPETHRARRVKGEPGRPPPGPPGRGKWGGDAML